MAPSWCLSLALLATLIATAQSLNMSVPLRSNLGVVHQCDQNECTVVFTPTTLKRDEYLTGVNYFEFGSQYVAALVFDATGLVGNEVIGSATLRIPGSKVGPVELAATISGFTDHGSFEAGDKLLITRVRGEQKVEVEYQIETRAQNLDVNVTEIVRELTGFLVEDQKDLSYGFIVNVDNQISVLAGRYDHSNIELVIEHEPGAPTPSLTLSPTASPTNELSTPPSFDTNLPSALPDADEPALSRNSLVLISSFILSAVVSGALVLAVRHRSRRLQRQ